MAFCNSCGANLTQGATACSRCGAPVTGAAPPRMSPVSIGPASTTPTPGSSSGLKTALIIVAVIAVLGIFCIATLTLVGLHIAKRTRVTQEGDHVKVETPFGRVETSKDPDQAAKDLGIDLYPGAELQRDGASTATFAGIRTSTAMFESEDAPHKICSFYQSRFPNARVSTSDQNRCTIVSDTSGNVVTINVESRGDGSRLQITTVNKKAGSSS
jgi:hypothetical protein